MIFKILFFLIFLFTLLLLVKRKYIGIDFASLVLFFITLVLAFSFSPYLVELLAKYFEFGTPSMAVIALVIVGLMSISVILLVICSDLKYKHVQLTRHVASLELRVIRCETSENADPIKL